MIKPANTAQTIRLTSIVLFYKCIFLKQIFSLLISLILLYKGEYSAALPIMRDNLSIM